MEMQRAPVAASTYVHEPLADDKDQIRLMRLLPGSDGEVVQGVLETFDLDNAPEYKALSYMWVRSGIALVRAWLKYM